MRSNLLFYLLMLLALKSCGQISDPLRNKIVLNDEINEVSDLISNLESLLRKLSENQVVSSSVDNEGYLYVNSKKLGLIKGALLDSAIRNDSIFSAFTKNDYDRFITITIYLLKNHIGYSMRDNASGLFVHGYRETEENSYSDVRNIMVNVDTTSAKFHKIYQILDRKENMVLVAPADAKIH